MIKTMNNVATIKATIDCVFNPTGFSRGWLLRMHIVPGQVNVTSDDMARDHGMFLCFNDMENALANVAIINESREYDRLPIYEIVSK